MAKIVDELITKYTLQDDYSAKANQVVGSTGKLTAALGGVVAAVTALGAALGAATVAYVRFGQAAVSKFTTFDTIERSFIGIYGSAEQAAQMMAYLEAKSLRSAFGLEAMATAASSLALAGIDVGKFLPVVERLALVSGQGEAGLADAASVLRRLRGGQVAEALGPEGLGRFGVNRQDLLAMGATFNAQGQFQGTIEQALDLIVRVAEGKLKRVADEVGQGAAATLSNIQDAWDKALTDAGRVIMTSFTPILIEATEAFTALVKSGSLQSLTAGFRSAASALGMVNWSQLAAGLVGLSHILQAFGSFMFQVGTVGPVRALLGLGGTITNMARNAARDIATLFVSGAAAEIVPPAVPPAENPVVAQIAQNTAQTAENTAKLLDLSRHIFGGGDLGRMGITPVEMGGGQRSSRVKIDVSGADGPFRLLVETIAMQIMRQMQGAR
jgi:hypothetical protein